MTGTDRSGELRLSELCTFEVEENLLWKAGLYTDNIVFLVLPDRRLSSKVQTFSFHGTMSIFGTFLYYVEIVQYYSSILVFAALF